MQKPKALVFDLNGTMIDDMEYHSRAWYSILNDDLKAGLSWEEVNAEMYGKNEELLKRIFGKDHFTPDQLNKLSIEKERRYQQAYLPHLALIKGLDTFLEDAKQHNILLAIGSAAVSFNVDFVLDNLKIREYFSAIVSADDVRVSKPDPETFTKAAQLLKVNAADCIVFEDAPKGVEAALNAGMKLVALTTSHRKEEFEQYNNVLAYIHDYSDPFLKGLFAVSPREHETTFKEH